MEPAVGASAGFSLEKHLQSSSDLIQLKAHRSRNEHRQSNARGDAIKGPEVGCSGGDCSRLGTDLPRRGRPDNAPTKPRIVAADGSRIRPSCRGRRRKGLTSQFKRLVARFGQLWPAGARAQFSFERLSLAVKKSADCLTASHWISILRFPRLRRSGEAIWSVCGKAPTLALADADFFRSLVPDPSLAGARLWRASASLE